MPKGEEEAEIRYNSIQNCMIERGTASDDLRSWEIIHFPTKILFPNQDLALNTKDIKPTFHLSPDCYFIRQNLYTFAVFNHFMIIRYELFFFLAYILRKKS